MTVCIGPGYVCQGRCDRACYAGSERYAGTQMRMTWLPTTVSSARIGPLADLAVAAQSAIVRTDPFETLTTVVLATDTV